MANSRFKSVLGLVLLGAVFGMVTPPAHATSTSPEMDDFAYTSILSSAQTSLRQLHLPTEVYEKLYRHDFGDLRIFSAEGQIVPYQLSRAETSSKTQISNLIFYPFNEEQAITKGNINIEINQATGKHNLKIIQSLSDEQRLNENENSVEYQYIIQNSNFLKADNQNDFSSLCKIKLYWKQSKPSLILGLKLEGSSDLQEWSSLSNRLNISRLNYENSQLVRDEVEFNCTLEPYIRLTWLNQEKSAENGVRLTSIQGFFTEKNAQKTQWKSFDKPVYNEDGHWLFESKVIAPLVKMEFDAPQNGLLYKGKLFSRTDEKLQWRFRSNINQYRLNLGDRELTSNPFSLGAINDRYWKFEPSLESQFTEAQLPEIRAAWRSNKVEFIAQGEEPFTFAFGHPNIPPAQNSDLNELIKTLKETSSTVDAVSLKEIIDHEKTFSSSGKTNWKKIALWFVLLLGTSLMAFMAYRLFKQMGKQTSVETKVDPTEPKEDPAESKEDPIEESKDMEK